MINFHEHNCEVCDNKILTIQKISNCVKRKAVVFFIVYKQCKKANTFLKSLHLANLHLMSPGLD